MLDRSMRQSLPARISAVGFILVVVFGNLWLALALTGGHAGDWISAGFFLGIVVALGGGVGLAVLRVKQLVSPPPPEQTEDGP